MGKCKEGCTETKGVQGALMQGHGGAKGGKRDLRTGLAQVPAAGGVQQGDAALHRAQQCGVAGRLHAWPRHPAGWQLGLVGPASTLGHWGERSSHLPPPCLPLGEGQPWSAEPQCGGSAMGRALGRWDLQIDDFQVGFAER